MVQLDHEFLDLLEEYGPIARTLSMCLRPTFVAQHKDTQMIWGDWSSIEARVLPWMANSKGGNAVLDVHRAVDADPTAPDVYVIQAGHIHNVDPFEIKARIMDRDVIAIGWRSEGKVSELALGFGGGVGALMAMAAGYGLHFEEDRAQFIVNTWRANNKWAKAFWDELTEAFFGAFHNPNVIHTAGLMAYVYDPDYHGGTIFCSLPDGRFLTYPNLKFRMIKRTNRDGEEYEQKTMTYRKGYKWGAVWHGILAENPTQGIAASILRAKMRVIDRDMEAAYTRDEEPLFSQRGHTHDEIIGESHVDDVPEARTYLKAVMEKPLDWTDGLPLVAEITDHPFYTKAID